jgi:hypothetical protein
MKQCRQCNKTKKMSAFYRHKKMADGRLNKCKACVKNNVSSYRKENIEQIRESDRERGKSESRLLLNKTRRRGIPSDVKSGYQKKWRSKNKEKTKAQRMVRYQLSKGMIAPSGCVICGKKAHAHHEDYSKPLEITWLCPTHHGARHAEIRALQRKQNP